MADKGSDEIFEDPCTPCAKEGKNVTGYTYCIQCDENMCETCLEQHKKFSSMKGHQITDKVRNSIVEVPEMPSERCAKHDGMIVDEYCPDHDKVGCSTCMKIYHSGCRDVKLIHEYVKMVDTMKELQQLGNDITTTRSHFLELKRRKQGGLESLKEQRLKLLEEIKSERMKIDDNLDKMETDLLKEVNEAFNKKEEKLDLTGQEVDATISSLEDILQKVNASEVSNDSERFVQIKIGQKRKEADERRLKRLGKAKDEVPVCFQPANEALKSNWIGQVTTNTYVESAELLDSFDVRTRDDKETCRIHDMCISPDGNIVMTDYNNKRIKKVNNSYKVVSSLILEDNPACICRVDESLMAVTLINKKKVQFVSQNSPMKLEQSFRVGDRCRGIACKDELIYVSCGGSKKRKEGVGHLEVYNASGSMVASYYDNIEYPLYISAPTWAPQVYISDHRRGVVVFDKDIILRDFVLSETPSYDEPQGICWLNENTLCLTCYKSNTVVQVLRDGSVKKVLLTKIDGIENPYSLCFDDAKTRLFVSFNRSNTVKVFNLELRTI